MTRLLHLLAVLLACLCAGNAIAWEGEVSSGSPSGSLISITTPEGRNIGYARQRLADGGELRTETLRKGNRREIRSDAQGRVASTSIFTAGATQPVQFWSFEYDKLDAMIRLQQTPKAFLDYHPALAVQEDRIGGRMALSVVVGVFGLMSRRQSPSTVPAQEINQQQ